jgi:hypothetical protein
MFHLNRLWLLLLLTTMEPGSDPTGTTSVVFVEFANTGFQYFSCLCPESTVNHKTFSWLHLSSFIYYGYFLFSKIKAKHWCWTLFSYLMMLYDHLSK